MLHVYCKYCNFQSMHVAECLMNATHQQHSIICSSNGIQYGTPNAPKIIFCVSRIVSRSHGPCRECWIEAQSRERVLKNVPRIDLRNDLRNDLRIDLKNDLKNVP